MKKIFLLLFFFYLSGSLSCQSFKEEPKGKTLALVNGQKLTEEDIEFELSLAFEDSIPHKAKVEYLNRWIENELLYQEAKRRGLEDNPEVKMRIRQAGKDVMVLSLLKGLITKQTQVSEEEAEKFYEQNKELFRRDREEVRASQILFSTQAQAESAFARIKKGEDFNRLAQELSTDPQAGNSGGDLGYFNLTNMHPVIAKEAFDLQTGMVSTPFRTEMGYHILKVMGRKPKGSLRDFEEVEDRLIVQMIAEKKRETVTNLLEKLKSKAKIERFGWARDSRTTR